MQLRLVTIAVLLVGPSVSLHTNRQLARRMVCTRRRSPGRPNRGRFRLRRSKAWIQPAAQLIETVGSYKQDSLTIIRHGKIVADAYYAPYIADVSHDLRSVTKSVVGALTAILLQKGSLDSVDHPVMDLFSGKEIQWVP